MSYTHHAEANKVVDRPMHQVFARLDDLVWQSAVRHSGRISLSTVQVDERMGRKVGSLNMLEARFFGMRLVREEVVIERVPPARKRWITVGEPRMLVIGSYRMGFDLASVHGGTRVTVVMDYNLPSRGLGIIIGRLFSRAYANSRTREVLARA
jgi:hypothetical protein